MALLQVSLGCDGCGLPVTEEGQGLCAACRKPRAKALPNEGIHPNAREAIEGLLDADLPMQVQHLAKRGSGQGVCGAFGQLVTTPSSVTCPRCTRIFVRRRRTR